MKASTNKGNMTVEELKKVHRWMLNNKKERFICFAISKALSISDNEASIAFRRTLYPIAQGLGGTQAHIGSALWFARTSDDYDFHLSYERRMKLRIIREAIKRGGASV